MVRNGEFTEIEKEDSDEVDEEISDEEFEQFIQQNRNNADWGERTAPVLESSNASQESLEESLEGVETPKDSEPKGQFDYSFVKNYGDVYQAKNYENEMYAAKTYGDLSDTKKLDLGRSLIDNTMERGEGNVDLAKLNMQQQQMNSMMGQQQGDNRRYLEIKQAQTGEARDLPFERATRRKERVLK